MRTVLAALLLLSATAQAQQTYQSRAAWESAASGVHTTYDFIGLTDGAPVGIYQTLSFEANDKADTDAFEYPIDGYGVTGGGPIRITMPVAATAIGIDHPGGLRITVYEELGGTLLYQSDSCAPANGPPGSFCGVVMPTSKAFKRVVVEDWWDGLAKLDNLELVTPDGPQPLVQCSTGALAMILMEWNGVAFVERPPVLPDGTGCVAWEDVPPGTVYITIGVGVMPGAQP